MRGRNSICFSLYLKRFILCSSILSETSIWNTPQLNSVTYWGGRTLFAFLRHIKKNNSISAILDSGCEGSFLFFTFLVLNKSLTKGSKSLVYNVDRVVLRSSVVFRAIKQCFLLRRDEIWDRTEEVNRCFVWYKTSLDQTVNHLIVTEHSGPITSSCALLAFDSSRKYIPLPRHVTKILWNMQDKWWRY